MTSLVQFMILGACFIGCWCNCVKDYCIPGLGCWPSTVELAEFQLELTGKLLQPFDANFSKEAIMKNTRVTKTPGLILLVQTTTDVQRAVVFARKHNIRITILSSGHSFTGRSTADGSLQINLSRMKNIVIDLGDERHSAGIITLGSGNTWGRVYEQVDKVGRLVVGGAALTVSIGGYTTGGGHSPLSRYLGLAADNLVEFEMVTADGSIVTASSERKTESHLNGTTTDRNDSDLFWAVRGGGGGTFGIVTRFTFKLHMPPPSFVALFCGYPLSLSKNTTIGKNVLDRYMNFIPSLPREWGGYLVTAKSDPGIVNSTDSMLFVGFLHHGPWSAPSRAAIDPVIKELKGSELYCLYSNVSTFWQWKKNLTDPIYFRNYVTNTLVQYDNIKPELCDLIADSASQSLSNQTNVHLSCTFTLLGGKVSEVSPSSAAISPAFRTSLSSLSCGVGWDDPALDDINSNAMKEFGKRLYKHGRGVYFNEPNEYLPNWKTDFWGPYYPRLLKVKNAWDPNNTFYCHHCVGSDSTEVQGCNTSMVNMTAPNMVDMTSFDRTSNETKKPESLAQSYCSRFCFPGHPCWPSHAEVLKLGTSLDGSLLTPNMYVYSPTVIMKNTLRTKHPGIVVIARTVADVQKAIMFAKSKSLRLTILSSGHDYTGKSTADGSFQVNLSGMKRLSVNMNDRRSDTGESITAEPGNTWGRVYIEVDKYDRVVVGGSALTVALGGYFTGGGHSPLSRSLGLGVDNVVAFQIVLADGTIANCTDSETVFTGIDGTIGRSPSTDLFWAVLGGGGGTFGVVTSFTFRLHIPPRQLVSFLCVYKVNDGNTPVGDKVMDFFNTQVTKLSNKWGGWHILSGLDPTQSQGVLGTVTFALLHYGGWNEPTVQDVFPLKDFMKQYQVTCNFYNHTSFLDYKQNRTDPVFYRQYITNTLLQNDSFTPELTQQLLAGFSASTSGLWSCTGTLIGGKVSEVPFSKTSMNPAFRTALSSLSCGLGWIDPHTDSVNVNAIRKLGSDIRNFGSGVYYNEPDANLPNWKTDQWGENYNRLLAIKQQWDRDEFFYCHHCVGSDLIENFRCNDTNIKSEITDTAQSGDVAGCRAYGNDSINSSGPNDTFEQNMNFCSRYCLLGNPCWPTDEEIVKFSDRLTGSVMGPSHANYSLEGRLRNVRFVKSPGLIVDAQTIFDIQQSVIFARRHNLRVTVFSSGHDFAGKSSEDGSLLINLSHMTAINVNLQDPKSPTGASATVDSGNSWGKVYQEIDRHNKLIVGGSAHTVSMGGYTTGGGHSPMSRTLGLAVDNLISFVIILPDGTIADVSQDKIRYAYVNGTFGESNEADLFWAVRGGGGATYGIVPTFTFQLHDPPSGFVHFVARWALDTSGNTSVGHALLKEFNDILPTLSPRWGGYVITAPTDLSEGYSWTITMSMLHFGDWNEPSRAGIERVENLHPEGKQFSYFSNVSTFWEYEKNVNDPEYYPFYSFSTFLQYDSVGEKVADAVFNITLDFAVCSQTLLGGKVTQVSADSAAISPAFRTASVSLSCAMVWVNQSDAAEAIRRGQEHGKAINKLGRGVYYNEPEYILPNWKTDFWGHHYDRLLDIKQKYDPNCFLNCHHCVGSDLVMDFYSRMAYTVGDISSKPINDRAKPTMEMIDFVEINEFVSRYCLPGMACWPSNAQIANLESTLDGIILQPIDIGYSKETLLRNHLYSKSPGLVVYPQSVADVQRAVLFARAHNLRVTVIASGHEFNGKNTADGSLQINLKNMTRVEVDLIDTRSPTTESVTVEGGASWGKIYEEVSRKYQRVVVGPGSKTVTPGGYTTGGGIGPLAPSLGLSVDNTIAFQMVTADGRIVNSTNGRSLVTNIDGSKIAFNDTELFWAVRGGGGATFGIVTSFTYQIHPPPVQFVQFECNYTPQENVEMGIKEITNFFYGVAKTLPSQWGGYLGISHSPDDGMGNKITFAHIYLLHYGSWGTDSRKAVDPFFTFRTEWQTRCAYSIKPNFWDYAKGIIDLPYERTYVSNGLYPPEQVNSQLTDALADNIFNNDGQMNSYKTCILNILGGKVKQGMDSSSSVHSVFRQALFSMTCSVAWTDPSYDMVNIQSGKVQGETMYNHSKGVYLNEAAYHLPNWKTDFWDTKYDSLLGVKKNLDPENFFYCRHCVGSDLVTNFQLQTRGDPGLTNQPTNQVTPATGSSAAVSPLPVLMFAIITLNAYL